MTHHAPIPPAASPSNEAAPRSNAEYRWTREKAVAFFRALAACGKVAEAARSVGMSRQAAYRLRARIPGLAETWREAQASGRALRRARGRRRKPVPSHAEGVARRPAQGDAAGAAR